MADQDTTVNVENGEEIDTGVETPQGADETSKDQSTDTSTENGTDENESESGDGNETSEENKVEFKKRFTQFEGETPEEYLKKLEDAYAESSTEGQRKAQEARKATERFDQVARLVASDPELAKKLAEATGEDAPSLVKDPAVEYARTQMEAEYKRDYDKFTETHPELVTDETKLKNLIEELDVIGTANEKRGVVLSMAEGLRRAWVSLGYDAEDSKEDVALKAKEQASSNSSSNGKKTTNQAEQFTLEQIAVAKKMGLTPKQLAEYNK